jgi:hypothetical protein
MLILFQEEGQTMASGFLEAYSSSNFFLTCNFMLFFNLSLVYLRFWFGDELNCHLVKKKKKTGGLGGVVEGTEQHQLEGVFLEKNDLY